jgi:hypothetical protein
MIGFMELLVILAISLPLVAVVGAFVVAVVLLMKGRRSRDQETRIVQQLHQQASVMQGRIESLEAILFEAEREGPNR